MPRWSRRSFPGLWAATWLAVGLAIIGCHSGGPGRESGSPGERETFRSRRMLMGTTFEIQVVDDDARRAEDAIEAGFAEVERVEELLSEWRETSEISAVNRAAGGQSVAVGPDLFRVVERSLRISELTHGAFDVTFASCGRLWSFGEPRVPREEELAACLARVGFDRLELDAERSTLRLPEAGMRIGIAGIGKGYGIDRAADVLESRGITDYLVDGGGDIRIRGANKERPWRLGIAHPRASGRLYATLQLDRGAIVTSGDYQLYFDLDGVRYHHILDPATGRPARSSIAVSVVAPTAMDADALATGLFVLGPERALAVVEGLPDVEVLVFGPDMKAHASSGFPTLAR